MKNKSKTKVFGTLKASLIRFVAIVIMLSFSIVSYAQYTVKGVVTDQNTGEPLYGVSVLLKNTAIGTATDFDGSYSLTLTEPHDSYTLVFSYLGYSQFEQTLTLDELIAATLILFPRYISPKTGKFCEVEQTLKELKEEQERYFNDRFYRYKVNLKGYLLPRARKTIRAILKPFKLKL